LNDTSGRADLSGDFSATLVNVLDRRLPDVQTDEREPLSPQLLEAMRYSVLSGGKYIRPALVYAAAEAVGNGGGEELDEIACAVEFIHAYSLIHDDLPSMDNDEVRRGKPACHVLFGEGIAILAGDALQVRAFELLAHCKALQPEQKLRMIALLARSIGINGMAGGQAMDLLARDAAPDIPGLEKIHRAKTGSLICASVLLGAIAQDADAAQYEALTQFAEPMGLAFQVRDDLLDFQVGNGAPQEPSDAVSYPAIADVETAQKRIQELHRQALAALEYFDVAADSLRTLSATMTEYAD